MVYVSQVILLYTLNFHSTVCQLHLSRTGIGEKKTRKTETTYHAVMPCSLTIRFAHATALAMSFSINSEKEMVRNEDNIHRNFIISWSLISFLFLGWGKNNQNFVFCESMYLWMLGENFLFPCYLAWNKAFCFSFTKVIGSSGTIN